MHFWNLCGLNVRINKITKMGGDGRLRNEEHFSDLIYEFFLMRIRFQYYQYGATLPPVDLLSQQIGVSAETVKLALRRLRDEGYIDLRNGRQTRVIFRQSDAEAKAYAIDYFAKRMYSFQDLCQSAELILFPMLVEGLRRADEADLAYLSRLAGKEKISELPHFFGFILKKLKNALVMNLFWEITFFWGFLFLTGYAGPYYHSRCALEEWPKRVLVCAARKDWAQLEHDLWLFQHDLIAAAIAALQKAVPLMGQTEQIPFVWRIYRERPQICYSLASRLLHEIYLGEYRTARYLPSYEKMAKAYHVSVSTMRRTVNLLRQVGAVRPINGKGIRIFTVGERGAAPNFKDPAIRRNLSFFVQALELVIYSCEGVTRNVLGTGGTENMDALRHELEACRDTGLGGISLWCYLIFMVIHSRLDGIREIYATIYGLFLWGYPLKASFPGVSGVDQAIADFADTVICRLKAHDVEGCAQAVKGLVTQQLPIAEAYLRSCGLQPEELRPVPPLQLTLGGG